MAERRGPHLAAHSGIKQVPVKYAGLTLLEYRTLQELTLLSGNTTVFQKAPKRLRADVLQSEEDGLGLQLP